MSHCPGGLPHLDSHQSHDVLMATISLGFDGSLKMRKHSTTIKQESYHLNFKVTENVRKQVRHLQGMEVMGVNLEIDTVAHVRIQQNDSWDSASSSLARRRESLISLFIF